MKTPSQLAAQRRYREKNKVKIAAAGAAYYQKNKDARAEKKRLYRKAKPWLHAENQRTRVARLRRAMPAWADRNEIRIRYQIAADLTEATGIKWSVDHIIPLAGKDVCGLHVPDNLILMPLDLNLKKGRRPISVLETAYSLPE